ncbi:MAG TPA: tetratricopeptide repeat protein [Terriglobales bacterium]
MKKKCLQIGLVLSFWMCSLGISGFAFGQTFEVGPSPASKAKGSRPKEKEKAKAAAPQAAAPEGGIGWGSGIEVARNARAAQEALQRNDYKSAVLYSTRAANAAPQNTPLWFLLGYAARLAGEYPASVSAFQRGLKNDPSSIAGLSGLAQTYAKMGRYSEAQDLLKQILAANPKSVNDLQLAGELALNSDPSAALGLLQRAEALQGTPRNELLIARAYQRLNQPDQSKIYLQRAESRAPNDLEVLRAVASYYRDSNQYDVAIATLQKIPKKTPDILGELAYTYQLAGKRKDAAENYAKAADGTPGSDSLQLSAAQALVNIGQLDRADDYAQRAAKLDPEHYRLFAVRGQIASLRNDQEEAIKQYRSALERLPTAVPEGPLYPISLHLSLAEAYRATDNDSGANQEISAARAAISQIAQIDPTIQPEYLRLRAVIEMALGQMDAAETDLKKAMSLDPGNMNITLSYANLLWRTNRKDQAFQAYNDGLKIDATNHAALTALGYLSRDMANPKAAEEYFLKVQSLYPKDYVSYLALGDLYTSQREFDKAQSNYEKAHHIAPNNPLVVSGGINSALEAHKLPVAGNWVRRAAANPAIEQNPQVMREHERYLTFMGQYAESAALGYKVIEKLPHDPEAPVYLAYDLLYLNRYQESSAIVQKFEPLLPKDKDLHLIAGYLNTQNGELREAADEFTKAIDLAPNVPTSYLNRGYVLNDLRQGDHAAKDFEMAIKLRPGYGEAYLGLAFSDLQMRRARPALKEVNEAAKILGESKATHLARAEAYRQQIMLAQAEGEYQAALKLAPNDVPTRLALADVQYSLHRYADSLATLKDALGRGPDDAVIYANMARNYAQLRDGGNAVQAITTAEKLGGDKSKVLLVTGETFLILGDGDAAMSRYSRALEAPDANRVETRLALANLFASESRYADAEQQVSLGFAESRVGEADPITTENLLAAAHIMMSVGEYDLATKYFQRAQASGADDDVVDIGLANAYLALGQTDSAQQLLKHISNNPDISDDYEYLIAMANVYRQQQDTVQALSAFARANRLVLNNESAERAEMALAQEEGAQLTPNVSAEPDASFSPIFEDINIYVLDARLRGVTNSPLLLPPPRSSYESRVDGRYRIHFGDFPTISGLVEERNARGTISIPSQLLIQSHNTYDTIFNGAINPMLHWGDHTIAFSPGLQMTVRRDTDSPVQLNQDLFRQFLYVYSSPFWNWLSFTGDAIHESGPFTEQKLSSRDNSASLNFVVGRPWGKTALITGYQARDVQFHPVISEYYTTSVYAGVRRKFGENLEVSAFAEYLRSWRVQDAFWANAEALRPAFRMNYTVSKHWDVQASGIWSRGEGFHAYDNMNDQFLVTYVRPVERSVHDGVGDVPVSYPMSFSFGIQQQTFYDFSGKGRNTFLPVIRLAIF